MKIPYIRINDTVSDEEINYIQSLEDSVVFEKWVLKIRRKFDIPIKRMRLINKIKTEKEYEFIALSMFTGYWSKVSNAREYIPPELMLETVKLVRKFHLPYEWLIGLLSFIYYGKLLLISYLTPEQKIEIIDWPSKKVNEKSGQKLDGIHIVIREPMNKTEFIDLMRNKVWDERINPLFKRLRYASATKNILDLPQYKKIYRLRMDSLSNKEIGNRLLMEDNISLSPSDITKMLNRYKHYLSEIEGNHSKNKIKVRRNLAKR